MTRFRQTPTQLDTAIDELLRGPSDSGGLDVGELTTTARLLRDALPRLHPRFTFEEHLASRLAAARSGDRGPLSATEPVPIRPHLAANVPFPADVVDRQEAPEHRRLGLVAGGAIASGVSLAGAALVVWRRTRSGGIF
jgi:hypothetical protein